jgi:hypothetical protein
MERFIAVSADGVLDLVAHFLGFDRPDNHDRAIDAARRGDLKAFRLHMNALERDIARVRWAG